MERDASWSDGGISPLSLLCRPATVAWAETPFVDFPSGSSGARVKASRDETKLRFLVRAPHDWEAVSIFLDPVGDREAYFEIGVTARNAVFSRAARRSRSGTKIDASWPCDQFESSVSAGAEGWDVVMSIPFASLGSIPPGPGWRVAFEQGAQDAFRPPRRFFPLDFGA